MSKKRSRIDSKPNDSAAGGGPVPIHSDEEDASEKAQLIARIIESALDLAHMRCTSAAPVIKNALEYESKYMGLPESEMLPRH